MQKVFSLIDQQQTGTIRQQDVSFYLFQIRDCGSSQNPIFDAKDNSPERQDQTLTLEDFKHYIHDKITQ